MEARIGIHNQHRHFLLGFHPYTSPTASHRHQRNPENARTHLSLSVAMKDLSLRRVSAKIITINERFLQDSKFFSSGKQDMATQDNSQPHESTTITEDIKQKGGEEKKEEDKKMKLPPPPPPEMPEPGDCCGSGCVRCVWDVYYEELEAYNKLYMTDSDSSKS